MPTLLSQLPRCRSLAGATSLVLLMAMVLAGCGASGQQSANVAPASPPTTATTTAAPTPNTATSTSAPSSSGPPSFVVHTTTQEGDRVRLEGRFGPALPASESDLEEAVLGGCTPPANTGRAVVVQLNLTVTLESSLSGKIGFQTEAVPGGSMSFVMGYSQGASCVPGEPGAAVAELGEVQPHGSAHFTMWAVLADAITPNDPHPAEKTLGAQALLMAVPQASVNGSQGQSQTSGPRVVQCGGKEYIAVVRDTSRTLPQQVCLEG
jgi:hypothetical protein